MSDTDMHVKITNRRSEVVFDGPVLDVDMGDEKIVWIVRADDGLTDQHELAMTDINLVEITRQSDQADTSDETDEIGGDDCSNEALPGDENLPASAQSEAEQLD